MVISWDTEPERQCLSRQTKNKKNNPYLLTLLVLVLLRLALLLPCRTGGLLAGGALLAGVLVLVVKEFVHHTGFVVLCLEK